MTISPRVRYSPAILPAAASSRHRSECVSALSVMPLWVRLWVGLWRVGRVVVRPYPVFVVDGLEYDFRIPAIRHTDGNGRKVVIYRSRPVLARRAVSASFSLARDLVLFVLALAFLGWFSFSIYVGTFGRPADSGASSSSVVSPTATPIIRNFSLP